MISSVDQKADRPEPRVSPVRRIAVVGNVCVGKTSLVDHLCGRDANAVNIPGSTGSAQRGVLVVGPAAASRAIRRECASCRPSRGAPQSCLAAAESRDSCGISPSEQKRSRARWTSAGAGPKGAVATHLFDTPGSATLAAGSEDEMVARDLLLSGQIDALLVVADAKNLRRSLALALEVSEFGLPMVFDLNMTDEAEALGLEIDDVALAQSLGVPVGRTVAVEGRGVRRLAELLIDAQVPKRRVHFPEAVERGLGRLEKIVENPAISPRGLAILLVRGDAGASSWVAEHVGEQALEEAKGVIEEVRAAFSTPVEALISNAFLAEAKRITERTAILSARRPNLLVRFGALAQQRLAGTVIALMVLALAYMWVGVFGATYVVDNLSAHLFQGFLIPLCERLVAPIPSAFVRDAIMDRDFGLLPTGLFLAVGVVLPVLLCFFVLQAILEDSGYLPRLAVLFHRLLRGLGLNGQGLIPLVLGFSCIAMAVVTTRVLPTRKERIILTLLLVGVPCAPLLAVMVVILGSMPWTAPAFLFGMVGLRMLVAGFVASKVIPGARSTLIMEIPQMRIPRLGVVADKTWRRTRDFMGEAVPLFLIASFVVFVANRMGGLAVLERAARPVVHGLLGLPDGAVRVFIKTAIRRETGATELALLRPHFSNLQLVVTLLVMTFLMPCINASLVILKERGLRNAMAIFAVVAAAALATGTLVNLICTRLGVSFM